MDLGIKGRNAIICASSQGLGKACAISLAREGCNVFINGRTEGTLEEAAREIVGLTGAIGFRFALEQHIELQAEAAYTAAINPVFSSDVITDNTFKVDNFALQLGVGYRF